MPHHAVPAPPSSADSVNDCAEAEIAVQAYTAQLDAVTCDCCSVYVKPPPVGVPIVVPASSATPTTTKTSPTPTVGLAVLGVVESPNVDWYDVTNVGGVATAPPYSVTGLPLPSTFPDWLLGVRP